MATDILSRPRFKASAHWNSNRRWLKSLRMSEDEIAELVTKTEQS